MENKFDKSNPNWFLENQEWWVNYSKLVRETGGEPSAEHFKAVVEAAPKSVAATAEEKAENVDYKGDLGTIHDTGSGQYVYSYAPGCAPGSKRFEGYGASVGSGSGSGSYAYGSGSGSYAYGSGSDSYAYGSGSGSYYGYYGSGSGFGSGSGMNAYGLKLI